MRVTVGGKELKAAISWGSKGVNRNAGDSSSSAQSVIELEGSTLTVKSFDGRRFFSATAPISGLSSTENASVRVFGPHLSAALNVLEDAPVTLEIKDDEVVVILPRSQFSIARSSLRAPKFPDTPDVIGTMAIADLRKAATRAATVALSGDGLSIPALGAVLFDFSPEDRRVRLEATDRVTLLVRDIEYVPETGTEPRVLLIPSGSVKSLLAGMGDEGDITLRADDLFFGVEGDTFAGYVGLESAQPVAYEKLMQMTLEKRFTFDRLALIAAIRNVTTMSTQNAEVYLHIQEGSLEVTDKPRKSKVDIDILFTGESGLAEDEIFIIKFNPSAINPALNAATTPILSMSFTAETKPVVFRETGVNGVDDNTLFNMVMPLR